jgi:hypothetical protein
MKNNELLKELVVQLDQLDKIRADLVSCKQAHIETLENAGLSTLKALKDWQQNFSNILQAMDSCNEKIREILHQK